MSSSHIETLEKYQKIKEKTIEKSLLDIKIRERVIENCEDLNKEIDQLLKMVLESTDKCWNVLTDNRELTSAPMIDSHRGKLERYQMIKEAILDEFSDGDKKHVLIHKFKTLDGALDGALTTIVGRVDIYLTFVTQDIESPKTKVKQDEVIIESRHPEMMMFIVIGYMIGIIFAQLIIR